MKLFEIIANYRQQIKDKVKPYLVDNDEAIRYFNEAQMEACRRARLLVDSTTENLARIPISAGVSLVELSPKIISVRRIRLQSSTMPLRALAARDMDDFRMGWETPTEPSTPRFAVMDYQTDAVFLYPTPAVDDVLLLTVTREPLCEVVEDNDQPEIPDRWISGCIEWMKFRTYANEDTDIYDSRKAETALARFESEFGTMIGAINERFEFEHYNDVGER